MKTKSDAVYESMRRYQMCVCVYLHDNNVSIFGDLYPLTDEYFEGWVSYAQQQMFRYYEL